MDRNEAKVKFQDADRLFQSKQYQSALDILRDLNHAYPNERHILYPMARSLTGLKRYPEAREIAQRLVTEFGYVPAQDLVDRIDRLASMDDAPVETPVLPSGLEDIVVSPANFGARKPSQSAPEPVDSWQPYALWILLVVGGIVLTIVTGRTIGQPVYDFLAELEATPAGELNDPSNFPPVPWGAFGALAIVNLISSYLLACFPAYWSIKVVDALRFNDFGSNMKDVAVTTLIGFTLGFVLILGWIIFLVILKRRYDLSIGKLFAVVLLFFIFDVLVTIPVTIVYNVAVTGSIL